MAIMQRIDTKVRAKFKSSDRIAARFQVKFAFDGPPGHSRRVARSHYITELLIGALFKRQIEDKKHRRKF